MIVRKNLKISIILKGSWRFLLFWFLLSFSVYLLYFYCHFKFIALPFAPVAVLGTALSIFLGFRNSSSYDRYWEARKIWGGIVNQSRTFARQVITLSSAKGISADMLSVVHRDIIYRHLAWINALRLQLRQQTDPELWKNEVQKFLSVSEWEKLKPASNKTTMLMLHQGAEIAIHTRSGIFDDYRHMQLDNSMTELYNFQGQCERIKNTPLPRQYDYFNRLFMHLFVILLPFSLLETFEQAALPLLLVPFTLFLGFVFYIVEGVGRRIEDPFENKITDIPMSALCRTIEIDLKQMLGEENIPEKLLPKDGFLF